MKRKPRAHLLSPVRFIERITRLPYRDLFGAWLLIVFAFSQMYFALSLAFPGHGVAGIEGMENRWYQFGDSLYFSIVTATTVGYGDFAPLGLSKALAGTEAMLGFAVLAVFVSKLVSHKQDLALTNVHRLAFQNAFSATREGFFILRRDCDEIIRDATDGTPLEDRSWDNLLIAFQKGQILLEGILDFYEDRELFLLDTRRENLLLESTYRTLLRVTFMLRALDKAKVPWRQREETMKEFAEFLELTDAVLAQWQKHVKDGRQWFDRLGHAVGEMTELGEGKRA